MYKPLAQLAIVTRDPHRILDLFGPESEQIQRVAQRVLGIDAPILGNDLEFRELVKYQEEPTILGVSDGHITVSCPFEEGLPYFQELFARHPNMVFVGHAFTSADLFAFRNIGIEIPLVQVQDTIIWHYLANLHLNKSGNRTEDGDTGKRGAGYMNLWTFLSLYTDAFNYKELFYLGHPEHSDVFNYNGADSLYPLLGLAPAITQNKLRKTDKLYDLHRSLAFVLGEMSRLGVQVDVPYVDTLKTKFEAGKKSIEERLPFNPKANAAAVKHFKAKGIDLANWQEATIREAVEDYDDEELALSLEYKEMGNGTDRWFAPVTKNKSGSWEGYLDDVGKVHPRGGFFTSTGRMQMVGPNLQNVSKRRVDRHVCECGRSFEEHPEAAGHLFKGISLGKLVRRAIIATPGWYLLKRDYSNAENRVMLHLAGYEIPTGRDLHTWVAEIANLTPDMEICKLNAGSPREAAKTIQHGSNYLEGIQLKFPKELKTARIVAEIEAGAREVWKDWTFEGRVVTFTGANLSQRTFGDKAWGNRKKSLEILNRYFGNFPKVRELQQRIMRQIETQKAVITPHGYYALSFGADLEDRCKTAASMYGQNPIAHFTKLALVDLWKKYSEGRPMRPILQIHDEILCEARLDVPPDVAGKWLAESMEIETPEMPNFVIPTDGGASVPTDGSPSNWRDMNVKL